LHRDNLQNISDDAMTILSYPGLFESHIHPTVTNSKHKQTIEQGECDAPQRRDKGEVRGQQLTSGIFRCRDANESVGKERTAFNAAMALNTTKAADDGFSSSRPFSLPHPTSSPSTFVLATRPRYRYLLRKPSKAKCGSRRLLHRLCNAQYDNGIQ
jgi:hypothetical protein